MMKNTHAAERAVGVARFSILPLVLIALLAFTACGRRDRSETGMAPGEPAPEARERAEQPPPPVEEFGQRGRDMRAGATIQEIVENPQAWQGKTVTISGEVEDLVSTNGVKIGGKGWLFEKELLVLAPKGFPEVEGRAAGIAKKDIIQATGTVKIFQRDAFQQEYGTEFPETVFRNWDNKPVLVAENVMVTARAGNRR